MEQRDEFVNRVIGKKRSGCAIENPEEFTSQMMAKLLKSNRSGVSTKMYSKNSKGNRPSVTDYDNDND